MNLRDALLDALRDLPGTRTFHVHALVSAPRKYGALFPYATAPRPRVYAQDILVLCSEETEAAPSSVDADKSKSEGTDIDERVFVTAISATLFRIPSSDAAILYVAKVDSTGQGLARPAPSPTPALVRALIAFVVRREAQERRARRVWVHVFARAERHYLFPNSGDHPAKRALGDARLCAWWRRVLGRVAQQVMSPSAGAVGSGMGARGWYVLPGLSALEAAQALGPEPQPQGAVEWAYGHPYLQSEVPLPYAPPKSASAKEGWNLGQVVPSFDDDPKSRFMDEIACTSAHGSGVPLSPQRKRRRTTVDGGHGVGEGDDGEKAKAKTKTKKTEDTRVHGELGVVSADEFWERMSFRQECVAGAVTGFFVLCFEFKSDTDGGKTASISERAASALAPRPGEVAHHVVKRVLTSLMEGVEFSTSAAAREGTGIIERLVAGLCGGGGGISSVQTTPALPPQFLKPPETPTRRPRRLLDEEEVEATRHETASAPAPQCAAPEQEQTHGDPRPSTPTLPPPPVQLTVPQTPPPVGKRIVRPELSVEDEVSPMGFPEPAPSRAAYEEHVYGHVRVDVPLSTRPTSTVAESGRVGAVTVLAVRKKKRV